MKRLIKTRPASYKEEAYSRLTRMRRRKLICLSEAQGHRCAYCCGETFLDFDVPEGMSHHDRATLEHLTPQSEPVQTNKDENHVMSCSRCNGLKGNLYTPYEFYNKLRVYQEHKPGKPPKPPSGAKLEKIKKKEDRTLALCLIIVNLWPDKDVVAIAADADTWYAHRAKKRNRKTGKQKIRDIARIVTADPRKMQMVG